MATAKIPTRIESGTGVTHVVQLEDGSVVGIFNPLDERYELLDTELLSVSLARCRGGVRALYEYKGYSVECLYEDSSKVPSFEDVEQRIKEWDSKWHSVSGKRLYSIYVSYELWIDEADYIAAELVCNPPF